MEDVDSFHHREEGDRSILANKLDETFASRLFGQAVGYVVDEVRVEDKRACGGLPGLNVTRRFPVSAKASRLVCRSNHEHTNKN